MKNKGIMYICIYLSCLFISLHVGYFIEINDNSIASLEHFKFESIIKNPLVFTETLPNKKETLVIPLIFSMVFFVVYLHYAEENRKFNRKNEEHGSAKWGNIKNFNKFRDKKDSNNFILSQNLRLSIDDRKTRKNNNLLYVGDTGSGKSRSVVIPNILQANTSFVVTDPKGSILNKTKAFLNSMGYKVRVLDLVNMESSNCYNPFPYLETHEDVFVFVDNLIENTDVEMSKNKGDPFWEHSQKALLLSIIFVLYRASEKYQNYNEVLKCIQHYGDDDFYLTKQMQRFQDEEQETGVTDIALNYYRTVLLSAGSQETLSSILVSTAVKLSVLSSPQISRISSRDEMDIKSIGKEKTAIFVVTSDTNKTFYAIASIFYTQLFQVLTRVADDNYNERLDIPVMFYLDEFANIGKIPNFTQKLATMRSRGMSSAIFLQNLSQLKTMYKEDWETIVGNCATFGFLGGTENALLKYLSEKIGKETTHIKTKGVTKSKTNSTNIGANAVARDLISSDELSRIGDSKCVVLIRGEYPVLDDKFKLASHKNYKYLNDNPENEHREEKIILETETGEQIKIYQYRGRDLQEEINDNIDNTEHRQESDEIEDYAFRGL